MTVNWRAFKNHTLRHRYPYLLIALASLLNMEVWYDLILDWMRDDNYSHGFLVVPVSIFVLYSRRQELRFPAPPSNLGLVLIVAGSLGLILGIAASEYFVTRVSLVMQLTGIGLAYLGVENFRRVWFAFFFLLFMIPIPAVIYYQATLPMQLLSTKITTFLLHLVGVPAIRQGHVIYLPDYSLEVIEACSGLRSLVALLALGSLHAWLYMTGRVRSVALVLLTIPIAMTSNVFRIFVTALGAYSISKELAESFLHEISGLLVFISAIVMMMIAGVFLRWTARNSS
jgi:exosortase